jgi:hypothetical protein
MRRQQGPPLPESEAELERRVTRLSLAAGINRMLVPLSREFPYPGHFIPTDPAILRIRWELNPHERLLATVHELTHATLHPAGADDFDQAEYEREEPCSHNATAIICAPHGVTDYREVMEHLYVPAHWLRSGDPETVEVMVERLNAALANPEECPVWARPVNKALWGQAKVEAATDLAQGVELRFADLVRRVYSALEQQGPTATTE